MQHLDEGTIHAWLDGALKPDESRQIEEHVASCATCSAAVAEARGLIAAASRILTSLDDVPADVIPGRESGTNGDQLAALRARKAAEQHVTKRRWWQNRQIVAAAGFAFLAIGTATVMWRGAFDPSMSLDAVPNAAPPGPPAATTSLVDSVTVSGARANAIADRAVDAGTKARNALTELKVAAPPPAALETRAGAGARREADAAPRPARVDSTRVFREAPQQNVAGAAERLRRDQAAQLQSVQPAAPSSQAQGQQLQGRTVPTETRKASVEEFARARRAPPQLSPLVTAGAAGAVGVVRDELAAKMVVAAAFSGNCYQIASATPGQAPAALMPSRVALDSTRTRVVGDTIWYTARPVGQRAGQESIPLTWRPLDASTFEIAAQRGVELLTARVSVTPVISAERALSARDAASPPPALVGSRVECTG